MAEVVLTPLARRDLIELWKYLADDSPHNADRFLDYIEEKLRLLADNPRQGRRREELGRGMRSFLIEGYLAHVIYYRPLLGPAGAEIIHVLHGMPDRRQSAMLRDEALLLSCPLRP